MKHKSVTYQQINTTRKDKSMNNIQLNQAQEQHLNHLKKQYEHHKTDQPYPLILTLKDWVSHDDGPDLDDNDYTVIVNTFTTWILTQK